jgi:hypothetical protein
MVLVEPKLTESIDAEIKPLCRKSETKSLSWLIIERLSPVNGTNRLIIFCDSELPESI